MPPHAAMEFRLATDRPRQLARSRTDGRHCRAVLRQDAGGLRGGGDRRRIAVAVRADVPGARRRRTRRARASPEHEPKERCARSGIRTRSRDTARARAAVRRYRGEHEAGRRRRLGHRLPLAGGDSPRPGDDVRYPVRAGWAVQRLGLHGAYGVRHERRDVPRGAAGQVSAQVRRRDSAVLRRHDGGRGHDGRAGGRRAERSRRLDRHFYHGMHGGASAPDRASRAVRVFGRERSAYRAAHVFGRRARAIRRRHVQMQGRLR